MVGFNSSCAKDAQKRKSFSEIGRSASAVVADGASTACAGKSNESESELNGDGGAAGGGPTRSQWRRTPPPAAQMLFAVSGIGLGLVDAFLSTLVILMWPAGLSAQSTQNVHQTEHVETSNVSTPVLDFVE